MRVSFGFYPFTAGIPKFYDIGSTIVDIDRSRDAVVSMDWTPPDLPPGEDHGCILVTLDYGYDSDFSGKSNFAQKNIRVAPASSPAQFNFRVENPLPGKAEITLTVTKADPTWTLTLSDTTFAMEPYHCARDVTAIATPGPNTKPGTDALFFITAHARVADGAEPVEIGGVALKARYQPAGPTISPTWVAIIVLLMILLVGPILWRKKR